MASCELCWKNEWVNHWVLTCISPLRVWDQGLGWEWQQSPEPQGLTRTLGNWGRSTGASQGKSIRQTLQVPA